MAELEALQSEKADSEIRFKHGLKTEEIAAKPFKRVNTKWVGL